MVCLSALPLLSCGGDDGARCSVGDWHITSQLEDACNFGFDRLDITFNVIEWKGAYDVSLPDDSGTFFSGAATMEGGMCLLSALYVGDQTEIGPLSIEMYCTFSLLESDGKISGTGVCCPTPTALDCPEHVTYTGSVL